MILETIWILLLPEVLPTIFKAGKGETGEGLGVGLEDYFLYPSANPTTVKTAPTKAAMICFHPKPGEPPSPVGSAPSAKIKMTAPTPNKTTPAVFFLPIPKKGFEVSSDFKSLVTFKSIGISCFFFVGVAGKSAGQR
jgi:hypothetical protein